jgi:hypothetical protein
MFGTRTATWANFVPKKDRLLREEGMIRLIAAAILASLVGLGSAAAQESCATKAVSKDGKPLAGAARTSAIKKCCEDSAVSAEGKKLSGAAKASFVKKCQADAKAG